MGGSSARFDYYSNKRKQGTLPSSHTYNSPSLATHKGGASFKDRYGNRGYSFGQSRHRMVKMHLDAILDPSMIKSVNNPGPGQHNLNY